MNVFLKRFSLFAFALLLSLPAMAGPENLLLNPSFEFHSFVNHRSGQAISWKSGNAAFWNTDKWGDITVTRESHMDEKLRPDATVGNIVTIAPGKKIRQFATLPELGLAHGDSVSLWVFASQKSPGALKARVRMLKLDSEDGEWNPSELGMADKRVFPRHSRGELVAVKSFEASSDKTGCWHGVKIESAIIEGRVTRDGKSHSSDINTIAVEVEFENSSKEEVLIAGPCLSKGPDAGSGSRPVREMIPNYRHIPRVMQKLWKGEPVHIVVMGSSIDRGSANPPMYPYDENPASPNFKKPLSDCWNFNTAVVGEPALNDYFADSRHYFSYSGRLKRELMTKFNMPADKLLLNFMACDGSCVGEAHSGLAEYFSLSLPPSPEANGHKSGKTWRELYPAIFERPEGPRPDLVIFGSGANEKTDTPDEAAVFEGMIRWIQRHYPETEFIFCQFQNAGGYTPNPGDMQAISLRYQIPFMDYGIIGDLVTRWCSVQSLVPADGHPQAASHHLWFKQLERAFEVWDPTVTGQAQLQLPERMHPNAYGWEGEMRRFDEKSPRIKNGMFIFEDTAVNCWGGIDKASGAIFVDGQKMGTRGSFPARNTRNSMFAFGRAKLGDRHVLEVSGKDARLTFVDSKICPDRRFFGVGHQAWGLPPAKIADFKSEFGAPFGDKIATLNPGETITADLLCTDISVAYADKADGGTLKVSVDGVERLVQSANEPYKTASGEGVFMENRKGVLNLGFGLHKVSITAEKGPVGALGVFTYDSRPNRKFERRLSGVAVPGETVEFSLPFKNRPFVVCGGGLKAESDNITPERVVFSGTSQGTYEVIGE